MGTTGDRLALFDIEESADGMLELIERAVHYQSSRLGDIEFAEKYQV